MLYCGRPETIALASRENRRGFLPVHASPIEVPDQMPAGFAASARPRRQRFGGRVRMASFAIVFPMSAASAAELARPAAQAIPDAAVKKPDWTVELGAFGLFSPKFFGAKDSKFSALPYVSIKYKDIAFASFDKGIGVNLFSASGFTAGAFVNLRSGREEKDSRRYLTGLGDIDPALAAGAFVKYDYGRFFSTQITLSKGIVSFGDDKNKVNALGFLEKTKGNLGTRIDWSADVRMPLLDNRLHLSVGPRVSFFDKEYAESAYGITVNQALASGYRSYKPKGGVGEVGVGGSARYRITDNLSATAFGSYTRLVGDAAKSPLVTGPGGSKDQFKAGLGLTYQFGL
ncbi:MipA/OmpV family protein [Bosea sp. LjRoot90]|uniref:MipA/OmpV family protein n=1 Tax=Bosea sp. LjRoot90 TaxID=3342342 RepID=UPI003ECF2C38